MSVLFPAIRTAVRASALARRPLIATPLIRTKPFLPPSVLAPLSIAPASRTHATKPPSQSENSPLPPGNTSTTNNSPIHAKDTLSGDVPIAPGGILAELAGESASAPRDLEAAPESGGGGVGLPPKTENYISSADRKRERIARFFYWGALLGLVVGSIYLGRPIEEKEKEQQPGWHNLPEGHSPLAYWTRFRTRTKAMIGVFREPAFEKILADKPPEPFSAPYTLLLDLEDFLVHSEWTREHGWRTAKRPGLDYFLGYLTQYYEIIVFSSSYGALVMQVVEKMDPYHTYWSGALFREHTRYVNGKVVKDLSHLNRDLTKVVILDTNPDSVSLQPENAIIMPKWNGEVDDKGLIGILPFLEYLASQNFNDVRPILKDYKEAAERKKITIAEEFSLREQMARAALQKTLKPARSNQAGPSFVSKLFGVRQVPPAVPLPVAEEEAETMTPLDYTRKLAQGGYLQMRKHIEEHGEEILEEDKKRQAEAIAESKATLFGHFMKLKGTAKKEGEKGPGNDTESEKKEGK